MHPFFRSKAFLSLLIEFGPIILFFVAFEMFAFIPAVIVLMIAVTLSLIASTVLQKRIAWFPVIASASVLIFGSLTLFLDDPDYIIFKDTLYFGFWGLVIVIELVFGRTVLKRLFENIFAITDRGWLWVSWNWGIFLLLLAISNEFARWYLNPDGWVDYKFIALAIIMVFSLSQFFISRKERLPEANGWGLRK